MSTPPLPAPSPGSARGASRSSIRSWTSTYRDAEDQGSGDEVPEIVNDELDLLQTVIDEAGLGLPFAPVCENGCDIETPEGVTTGVSGEEEDKVDPRWSGLEKFL